MPKQAVAAYLQGVRKGRGFTQAALAETVGVSKHTIERLERSQGNIAVESFMHVLAALHASPEQVYYLATHRSATPDEGKQLAHLLLQGEPSAQGTTSTLTAHHLDAAIKGVQTYLCVIRERRDIPRTELAEVLELSVGILADWETGRSTDLAHQALLSAVAYLGASCDDLVQILLARSGHETLGYRLATAHLHRTPHGVTMHGNAALPRERMMLQRQRATEGFLHHLSGILKRALASEAPEIERLTALWFQAITDGDHAM